MAHTIPVLKQAIQVLHRIAAGHSGKTKDLVQDLGLSPSTGYRIVQTFQDAKWLQPNTNGEVELSWGLLPIVRSLDSYELMVKQLRKHLDSLSKETGFSSKISVRQDDETLLLVRAVSPKPMAISANEGSRFSVLEGSSGAVLLADEEDEVIEQIMSSADKHFKKQAVRKIIWQRIQTVRKKGYCLDEGVYHQQIHVCSLPIQNAAGDILGALSVIGWPGDFSARSVKALLPVMKSTAAQCSKTMETIQA